MKDFGRYNAFGGGARQDAQGPSPFRSPPNSTGGKAMIKYNPSSDEITAGIRAQNTLFSWESPDGQPHYVTVEIGRVTNGFGGPNADGEVGQTPISQIGAGGGGSFPAAKDAAGNPLYYRAYAQILLGTPGTMQDPFFIDINRGQRFTACASYVAVTAAMRSTPLSEKNGAPIRPTAFGTGPAYVSGSLAVYATLGVGYAPSVEPLLFTQYIDTNSTDSVGNPVTYNRVIPPRANRLVGAQGTNAGDTLKVQLDSPAEDGFLTPPFANGELGAFGGSIPISGDSDVLLLTSTSNVPASFKLIYQISV